MGYKAIRAQSGFPGSSSTYGVAAARCITSRRRRMRRRKMRGRREQYLNFAPQLFSRLRKEFGPDIHLLHDAHHRLTPIEAARLGKELEPYHMFWLEDPTPAELQESFRLIRQHTTTPLAVGEVFNTIFDCQQLIEEQLIDYIRTTVVHAGGITHLKKIASLAEIYQVRTGSHGATDLSPGVHGRRRCISTSACTISEFRNTCGTRRRPTKFFRTPTRSRMASCIRAMRRGIGVDIDEKLAATYPYQRAYLPVNRKLDGTMHNW